MEFSEFSESSESMESSATTAMARMVTTAPAKVVTRKLAVAALVATALAGCGEDLPAGCEDSPLTYATFGEPFMTSWCRGCHSRELPPEMRQLAPLDVNFNTLDEVRRRTRRVAFLIGDSQTMPPAGGPSAAERALAVEWLRCGAP
jgi:uncharacterized membrane protein